MQTDLALLTLLMSPVVAFIAGIVIINLFETWSKSLNSSSYRDGV